MARDERTLAPCLINADDHLIDAELILGKSTNTAIARTSKIKLKEKKRKIKLVKINKSEAGPSAF